MTFDTLFGLGQSAMSSFSHGFHRFNKKSFYQGIEFTVGGILDARILVGIGYRRFDLSYEEGVAALSTARGRSVLCMEHGHDTMEVYRVREPMGILSPIGAGPLQDAMGIPYAHDSVVAVSRGRFYMSQILGGEPTGVGSYSAPIALDPIPEVLIPKGRFRYIGTAREQDMAANPMKLHLSRDRFLLMGHGYVVDEFQNQADRAERAFSYNAWGNNCQHHASALLRHLTWVNRR